MDDIVGASPMTPRPNGPLFIDKHCPECGALLVRSPSDIRKVTDYEGAVVRGTAPGTHNDEFNCPTNGCSIDPDNGKKTPYWDWPESFEDELQNAANAHKNARRLARPADERGARGRI